MKNLVVYYSLEGNTRLIAEMIAKATYADVLELKPKKEFPSGGFKKYVWGGKSVVLKEKPELVNETIDLSQYCNIFLGTPIWASTYAAPFNTFFATHTISGKNIMLFACHAGGSTQKTFSNFKSVLANNEFKGEIDFLDPLKEDCKKAEVKVEAWIASLNL